MSSFKEIRPEEIGGNVFERIGKQWMLITAGEPGRFNTMTASWGGLGVIWGKPASFCFVRPQRHTFGFMENAGTYTLSFLGESYRAALNLCGTRSGRDCDKVALAGLTPVFSDGTVYFDEAELVLVCRKQYADFLRPEASAGSLMAPCYPGGDYHKMYIGSVEKVLIR